jgi:hypothetical protein
MTETLSCPFCDNPLKGKSHDAAGLCPTCTDLSYQEDCVGGDAIAQAELFVFIKSTEEPA